MSGRGPIAASPEINQGDDRAFEFVFDGQKVRASIDAQGNPRVLAHGVCRVLGLGNPAEAVSGLDDDEKSNISSSDVGRPRQGGGRPPWLINESGLYALIFNSRKIEARRFRRWVTSEVLPSIRKRGFYGRPLSRTKTRLAAEQLLLEWNSAALDGGEPGLRERSLFVEHGPRLAAEHPEMLPAIAGEWLHSSYQGMLRRERRRAQTYDHPNLPGFVGPVSMPGFCTVIRDGREIAVPRERLSFAEKMARLGHRYRRRGGLGRWQSTTLEQDRAFVAEHNLLHPAEPITPAMLALIAPDLLDEHSPEWRQ